MKDIYLQSKLVMAKTLHSHGVDLLSISVATGLSRPRIMSELKLIAKDRVTRRAARKYRMLNPVFPSPGIQGEGCSKSISSENSA